MEVDPILDYNVHIVETHLNICESCAEELRRTPAIQEKLDKRILEAEQLTADEVHRLISQPEAGSAIEALPADE
jgi:anti-sigma factor ChrR (cupin superfamily)